MNLPAIGKSLLLAAGLLLAAVTASPAQFIRIVMEVEPELKTETVQTLQFGNLYQNSGAVQVSMGEGSMGIFSISGNPMQAVRVSLQSPDVLRHADRSLGDSISVTISAAYANLGVNRIEDARLFDGDSAQFPMMRNAGGMTAAELMRDVRAYIFIFGGVTVGDVEPGLYSGEIVLEVEYL